MFQAKDCASAVALAVFCLDLKSSSAATRASLAASIAGSTAGAVYEVEALKLFPLLDAVAE